MPRFVPRERKHKRLARQSNGANHPSPVAESNATEIIPESAREREARRLALQQQLREQTLQSKMSTHKRRRLEKYVETKLRKEESAELLRKLSAQKIDTSMLRSSKTLGQRHKRREAPRDSMKDESDGESDSDSAPATTATATFGSGLKRPLDVDDTGVPILPKRKRRKRHSLTKTVAEDPEKDELVGYANWDAPDANNSEEEWLGFSEPDSESASERDDSSGTSSADNATDDDEEENSAANEKPARISAFKAWADSQRNATIGFTPTAEQPRNNAPPDEKIKANFTPRAPSPDPLLEFIPAASSSSSIRPATAAIAIPRSEDIQTSRLELPVVQEEQKIVETINANPITIICGATGSGKTTQVPQMLFENGYGSLIGSKSSSSSDNADLQAKGMIGITQPRRVAATSVAERVAYELGSEYKNRVAHRIRFETNVSKDTAIKFMTDGILLREIQSDFPLSKYSCIIIDEAHERSVNTDILIGLLSRIVPLRAELATEEPARFYPLKLVIMSATLRVEDFLQNERLFRGMKPPVVEVEGRQYGVTEHFVRRTRKDYVSEVVEKVARGHRKLPGGGMLVFLTGQQEIRNVARLLEEKLDGSRNMWNVYVRDENMVDDYEDDGDLIGVRDADEFLEGGEDVEADDSDAEINVNAGLDNEFNIQDEHDDSTSKARGVLEPHILPLYAALTASEQRRVFLPPPSGHRTIILATNIAETSLTIPGIRYVFDSGRCKEKRYDQRTGIQSFEIDWISKASAAQRKGRAGRTGPGGHIWRLYSSAIYEQYFEEFTVPEILRTPLESVILQLKGLEIERVANFPFPTAPEASQLVRAEKLLRNLGAIGDAEITGNGKEIMGFPVNPRLGRMLVLAKKYGVVPHAVAMVAGLAVGDLYIPETQAAHLDGVEEEENMEEDRKKQHQAYTRAQARLSVWDGYSDAMKLLTAVAVHAAKQSIGNEESKKFCKDYWLREKGMDEVQQLRKQLQTIFNASDVANSSDFELKLPTPTDGELTALNQITAAGYIDQVAIRADMLEELRASFGRRPKRAIDVAYRTLIPTVSDAEIDRRTGQEERAIQKSVFIHPSSVLAKLHPKEMPQYIVYSHLSRAPTATIDGMRKKKTRMHPLTAIGPKVLAFLAEGSPLLEIGKPMGRIDELPDRRRQCLVGISIRAEDVGGIGWPLTEWKVVQKRGSRGEWTVEKVVDR